MSLSDKKLWFVYFIQESYNDLLEVYKKVSGLVDKLNEVMNKSVSSSFDSTNNTKLSKGLSIL